MRGTPQSAPVVDPPGVRRIIPAHAGNSSCCVQGGKEFITDHPRACGELVSSRALRERVQSRIIPAHAGNSGWIAIRTKGDAAGSSPRMRGTQLQHRDTHWLKRSPGSSPRMRGTLRIADGISRDSLRRRIIPAHAGNSRLIWRTQPPRWIGSSPRMRGTHPAHQGTDALLAFGSSPRMRGTRVSSDAMLHAHDVGSSPRMRGTPRAKPRVTRKVPGSDHPRACGELTRTREVRTRGGTFRIIPAHAGNSRSAPVGLCHLHPDRIIPAHAGNSSA